VRRAFATLVLGVLVLGSMPFTATPAVAAPSFSLARQTPWVQSDGRVEFDLTIVGAPLDATVNVAVHAAVVSRTAFDLTLEGAELGAELYSVDVPVGAIPAVGSSERRLGLRVGAGEDPAATVPITGPGVYPVELSLIVDDEDDPISFVTHVVVVDDNGNGTAIGEPLGVAWVWPLDVDPELTDEGMLTPDGVAELRTDGRLGRQIDALAGARIPVTLAPSGFAVEQLRELDLDTGRMLDDILASPNQIVTDGYVPLDVPSLLDAGLDRAVTVGRLAGAASLEAALGGPPDTSTSLAVPIDHGALDTLVDNGVRRMIVDEDDLSSAATDLTRARPFHIEGGDRTVLAATFDPGLGALLEGSGAPALRAQQLLAAMSLVAYEAPNRARAVVIVNPARWDPEVELLDSLLGGLVGHPLLDPMTLDRLFESIPQETDGASELTRTIDASDPPQPPTRAESYLDATRRQDAFRSFAGPLSPRLTPGDRALLVALASTWGPRSPAAERQLSIVESTIEAFLAQIHIPVDTTITLTARTGSIPLQFVNDTGQEVTVRVMLESDKLDFPDGRAREIVLPPRSSTEHVDVETLTPGRFPLLLTVTSPDGEIVVSSARIDVRSTAVSGVGVFLTAGAGFVLAAWWINDLRKRHRARAASIAPAD
jgi:hypothetical protein